MNSINKRKKKSTFGNILIKIFFAFFSLIFILPLLMIISISLTNEAVIYEEGYKLIPKYIDTTAYKYVFKNMSQVLNAYKTTVIFAFGGTFLSVLVMALIAYPLSKKTYKYRRPLMFYVYFTMLFSGGLIPSYILNTQYLGLGNTIWVYILPSLASAWHIIIIRTFFQGLPSELSEAAKIDGCGEWRIFFTIILPLSKPVLATVSLLTLLSKWNDWQTTLIYIRNQELYSLQYLLQKILDEAEFLKKAMEIAPNVSGGVTASVPTETTKFAMCIVAAGPMLVVFPFFQKYFTGGLTVGAVKG